jgi:hypothetical protein
MTAGGKGTTEKNPQPEAKYENTENFEEPAFAGRLLYLQQKSSCLPRSCLTAITKNMGSLLNARRTEII